MDDFHYSRATNVSQAVGALAKRDTRLISGGTELLNWMRLGIVAPENVIDIAALGLDQIGSAHDETGEAITIGSRCTLAQIGENPQVRGHLPALTGACLAAASPQIRNRATLGGNIMQKTRCAYFRAEAPLPWGCNKREANTGCAALRGVNERHAILGWTDACVATQPSDPLVALVCLDATVILEGSKGPRSMPVRTLHRSQQEAEAEGLDAATAETRLLDDEVIIGFSVPIRAAERSAYLKVRERASYEYSLVSAAAAISMNGDCIESARVALGSVAQRPWRLDQAESALIGRPLDREVIRAVVTDALAEARPLSGNVYKIEMAINAATRALVTAGKLAGGEA